MHAKLILTGIAAELKRPVKDNVRAMALDNKMPLPRNIGSRTPHLVQSSKGHR